MKPHMKRMAAVFLLAFTTCTVVDAAGPIYRCGREYSQTPCSGGRLIDTADPRSAAQRAEAQRVLAREQELGAQMERERRAQEAGHTPALAGVINGRPAPAEPAASSKSRGKNKKKAAKPAVFKAVAPVTKAKRAQE